MASDEDDPPDIPDEGINTLAAQATRASVDKIIAVIRRERAKGSTELALAKALEKNLPDYDPHTRALLLKLGFDAPIADDFPAENVVSSQQVKANTLELTVKEIPRDVGLFNLVRHQGKEWLIVESQGLRIVLKLLQ